MSRISNRERKRRRMVQIVERDGDRCWFCARRVPADERCLYHLRPRALGGSGRGQTNQVMACQKCVDGASSVWPIKERIDDAAGHVRFKENA